MEIARIQFLRVVWNYGAENCSERKLSALIMNIFERFFAVSAGTYKGNAYGFSIELIC